jgi:hypothetical protein
MKTLYLLGLTVLIAGCASHSVRCSGALQPINLPAPALETQHKKTPSAAGIRP